MGGKGRGLAGQQPARVFKLNITLLQKADVNSQGWGFSWKQAGSVTQWANESVPTELQYKARQNTTTCQSKTITLERKPRRNPTNLSINPQWLELIVLLNRYISNVITGM